MASLTGESFNVSLSVIPIFGGENYEFWKVKMKRPCSCQRGYGISLTKVSMNLLMRIYLQRQKRRNLKPIECMVDAKALSKLQNEVSSSIFPRILELAEQSKLGRFYNEILKVIARQ
jgi:hypothetical protein